MTRNFRGLEAQMPPESLAQAKAQAREIMADMLLSEVRKLVGLTQEQLADELQIRQPTLSRMESQSDMQITTLQRLVKALGGELEIIVHLPQGDIRLTQFGDAA